MLSGPVIFQVMDLQEFSLKVLVTQLPCKINGGHGLLVKHDLKQEKL